MNTADSSSAGILIHTGQHDPECREYGDCAAQEPTDAEVLAALNAITDLHGPPEPHLGRYAPRDVDEMRRAIAAARAARRNEETR